MDMDTTYGYAKIMATHEKVGHDTHNKRKLVFLKNSDYAIRHILRLVGSVRFHARERMRQCD